MKIINCELNYDMAPRQLVFIVFNILIFLVSFFHARVPYASAPQDGKVLILIVLSIMIMNGYLI